MAVCDTRGIYGGFWYSVENFMAVCDTRGIYGGLWYSVGH